MWQEQEVVDYFDSHLMVTLLELSSISGWCIPSLRELLEG
jgi:hypothetical protein